MEAQIRQLANKVRSFKAEMIEFAATVIEDNATVIEDYNRDKLYEGVDIENKPIQPGYTPLTKRIKRSKGQPDDRVTYLDKGDYYKGIELRRNGNVFTLVSTDEKTEKIRSRSPGNKLTGIPQDKIEEFYDNVLIPNLIDHGEKYLQGK